MSKNEIPNPHQIKLLGEEIHRAIEDQRKSSEAELMKKHSFPVQHVEKSLLDQLQEITLDNLTAKFKEDNLYKIKRVFTTEGTPAFDTVKWIRKDAVIVGSDGKEKFRQNSVEVPENWPDTTINIVAEKYFRMVDGIKETSAKQMFSRVANFLANQAVAQNIMSPINAEIYREELLYMFVHGMHAFNSPVWFNMGIVNEPQCSACFIQSVDDTMESITELAKKEVMLFKGGSGTGSNLSNIRSSYEYLSGGGKSSGPVSFMKMFDAGAGVTKSGGTTRRAAKMVVLNIDHPDILEQSNGESGFITCKSKAEQIAHDLYSTDKYTAEWNKPGNVYDLVGFQNANNSVRVTDAFMQAVEEDRDWETIDVKPTLDVLAANPGDPAPVRRFSRHTYKARHLWNEIAQATWFCGDPGIQFDTATNEWHTCPNSGRINASNPCQPAWATVLTKEGIRTFDDIKIGTEIWSGKQWTKVTRKIATGIKPIYCYYTRAGVFVGTQEHKVISEGCRVEVQSAETIDAVTGPTRPAYPFTHEFDQAMVDGMVFGDGYVKVSNSGRDHYPLLCIGKNDSSYFDDNSVARFINKEPFDGSDYRVVTTLTKLELPKTYLRQIPDRFRFGNEIVVSKFLRGLYSANGSIVGNRITLKAASFSVICQVQEMLSSLGIRSYYTVNKPTEIEFSNGTYTCKESYDLNITTGRLKFANTIGFIQPYKQMKLEMALETEASPRGPKTSYEIIGSKYIGTEPVFDIEVEAEEHTYWTGGLLVSNCSEYLFLDDTACNLSSLNLLRFANGRKFKLNEFIHACELATISKELIVDSSSYPSPKLKEMSHRFRTLGLGYTNLGALLTYWGLPYDSVEGRNIAAAITAVMTGAAYKTSANLARIIGPFDEYSKNSEAMLNVIMKHWDAAKRLPSATVKEWRPIIDKAYVLWNEAYELGTKYGFRNAQTTVLAPTGTISFLMLAETTGVEPMTGCIIYKKVVGEGLLVLPNGIIEPALKNLGYSTIQITQIMDYISSKNTIHGSPDLKPEHASIFSEALGPHAIRPEGHVDMMIAVQPFLSGGISKTINMPKTATSKDIADMYMRSWKGGLKCVAVYRDGCKLSQPISTEFNEKNQAKKDALRWGGRRKLPQTRDSKTLKFTIGQQEGYLHAGLYPDGTLGEMFVETAKQGSALMGFVDAWAQAVSIGLQHGVPFEVLKDKFIDMIFEPNGLTDCKEIRIAKSIPDFVFRWLDRFIVNEPNYTQDAEKLALPEMVHAKGTEISKSLDGPPCTRCGNLTKRAGSCYCCQSCGTTTGCS